MFYRKHLRSTLYSLLALGLLASCASPQPAATQPGVKPLPTQASSARADVLSVSITGMPGAYQFSVEVRSPDLGCEQYADWWEIIDEQGNLIYRRILTHSHVSEQPFQRAGGPVAIQADTIIYVRAHMHPGGYGGQALRGSVLAGFQNANPGPDFAAGLATTPPLPQGCDF
ncbi:MAG: hypothetical protein AB1894_00780 [Chloroflexota bacterium]